MTNDPSTVGHAAAETTIRMTGTSGRLALTRLTNGKVEEVHEPGHDDRTCVLSRGMADEITRETVFRGYKTELDPTRDQAVLFMKHSGTARWAYNWGLQRKIETYRATGKTVTRFDLEKELV